jgi:hypothetical protein
VIVSNPYQEVIDWLRSPEGERWSESRMQVARVTSGSAISNLNSYGCHEILMWKGIFSIKRDDDPRAAAFFHRSGQHRRRR